MEATRHAADCSECRERVTLARDEDVWVRGRLTALDVAPPRPDVAAVINESPGRLSSGAWRRAAAVALLFGGAGIAWAVPAVREFVSRVTGRQPLAEVTPGVQSDSALQTARPDVPPSGIAVRPGARFLISFEASQLRGEIRIRLVDGPELSVIALGAAVPLESGDSVLVVSNRGSAADFRLEIPSGAPNVEVRVAGVSRFLKRGANIVADDSSRPDGLFVIPFRR